MSRECSATVVLIVEDDWLLRQTLAMEVRKAGWNILESGTGEGALTLSGERRIDLLVTDIRLAGELSGWDVAEALCARSPGLPVVYVSGTGTDATRMVPGSTFLAKPCDPAEVIRACRLLLASATNQG